MSAPGLRWRALGATRNGARFRLLEALVLVILVVIVLSLDESITITIKITITSTTVAAGPVLVGKDGIGFPRPS